MIEVTNNNFIGYGQVSSQDSKMEDCMPEDLLLEYKQAFQMLDRKRIGKITIRDVATVACSIGMQMSERELCSLVSKVVGLEDNVNAVTRCIDFPDFLSIMANIVTFCVSEDEIGRIFREFDKDGDGFISPRELRELLGRLGDDVTDDDLEAMMLEADKDGDGLVSLSEFIHVMTHTEPAAADTTAVVLSSCGDAPDNVDCGCADNTFESISCCRELELESSCPERKRKRSFGKRRKSIIDWIKGKPMRENSNCTTVANTTAGPEVECTPSCSRSSNSGSCSSSSDMESNTSIETGKRRRSSLGRTLRATVRKTLGSR